MVMIALLLQLPFPFPAPSSCTQASYELPEMLERAPIKRCT